MDIPARPFAGPTTNRIKIYQIYFSPDQLGSIDRLFIPYDNSASPRPDEHEFYVFRKEYLEGKIQAELQGYFSWKFQEKTGLKGSDFINFCLQNPGHDVYFINPFPNEICHGNIWRQAEMWTPGITKLTQELLDRCGYAINLATMPRKLTTTAYCNYWVGTAKFWEQYMYFCLPLYDFLHVNQNDTLVKALLSTADSGRKVSYFAFIFERLFSTLLAFTPGISYAAYTYSRDELRQRYPRSQADFIANLQDIERAFPEDPEPLLKSPTLIQFLHNQERAIHFANRDEWHRHFNKQWQRWTNCSLRQKMLRNKRFKAWEVELFTLLNPGLVHWRKDL